MRASNIPMSQSTLVRLSTALGIAFTLVTACLAAGLPPDQYTEWTSNYELFVPMRDGVHLSTDVLLPKGATGKLPTILIRSPYFAQKVSKNGDLRDLWLRQGFAVVVQNERGLALSEGVYRTYAQNAKEDGNDTLDWIVKQPWSNGKVGTIGCSSSGDTQPLTAANNNPALLATIPAGTWTVGSIPENYTQGVFYRGGVPYSGFYATWYEKLANTERMVLPPDSTQAERVRLRTTFWGAPKSQFAPTPYGPYGTGAGDLPKFMVLPPQAILRKLGGALTPYDTYITYTPADPRWKQTEYITASTTSPVPALHVTTLYDPGAVETTRWYRYLQDQGVPNQFLVVGGGPHCSFFLAEYVGAMSLGEKADEIAKARTAEEREGLAERESFTLADMKFGDLQGGDARYAGEDHGYAILFLRWFNHWLRGDANNVTSMPKVQIYVMNKGWISGDHWPFSSTHFTNYYLRSWGASEVHEHTGSLSTSPADHAAEDSFTYDPANPTPSQGGGCCGLQVARDQRPVEARQDVLVYSTEALKEPVTIAGPVEADLFVSSSARDTDFMVKLVDVYPDGKAINLTEDAFRVRYRDGYEKKVMMERGKVYEIKLTDMVAAIKFPVGHRIRLDIASSNFPTFDRNLNTGGNNFDETTWVVARNTVHHGPQERSHLVLPVIPDGE
jgi:uncharacterized protein